MHPVVSFVTFLHVPSFSSHCPSPGCRRNEQILRTAHGQLTRNVRPPARACWVLMLPQGLMPQSLAASCMSRGLGAPADASAAALLCVQGAKRNKSAGCYFSLLDVFFHERDRMAAPLPSVQPSHFIMVMRNRFQCENKGIDLAALHPSCLQARAPFVCKVWCKLITCSCKDLHPGKDFQMGLMVSQTLI